MDTNFLIGLFGAVVLVIGAAWPAKKVKHPTRSVKNWLFAVGGLLMLTYSSLNYLAGGSVFFVFLQALVNVSSVLMMLNTSDKVDVPVLSTAGVILIAWSLYLFEGYNTVFFVVGLIGISLGYAFDNGTARRNFALLIGSALIATFSYIEKDMIFFWLNVFFAIFSAYYAYKLWSQKG